MKNQKITVELWTAVDDDRAAHVNGGSMTLSFSGTVGATQQTGDKQFQVNLFPHGQSYGHCYRNVYTYYPGYGYYHTCQSS